MTIITMGKERTYSLQTDDDNQAALLANLKKDYETLETQVANFTLQKDESFKSKIGEEEMEYPIDMKGFSKLKKDMEKYYSDMMGKAKCDADMAMKALEEDMAMKFKAKQDSIDAEIEVLKAELSNRDSLNTEEIIAKNARELALLVNKATPILNVDSDVLFNKSAIEIKKEVIAKTYPTLNLDNKTDVAIDAMFETCELYQNDSKRIIEEQKRLINNAVPINNLDSQNEVPKQNTRMQYLTTAGRINNG